MQNEQPANNQQQEDWSFHPENNGQDNAEGATPEPPQHQPNAQEPIQWTGSEFISNHKNSGWFLGLGLAIFIGCIITFVITRGDLLSVGFIAIVGVLFGIIASKKPRQLQYMVDDQGLTVGGKFYPFGLFKSFSFHQDGAIGYMRLLPLKRLSPELSIYFAPEDEERIFNALSAHLPHEDRDESRTDRLARHIRF